MQAPRYRTQHAQLYERGSVLTRWKSSRSQPIISPWRSALQPGSVSFWDPATGAEKTTRVDDATGGLSTVCFSPDGKLIAGVGIDHKRFTFGTRLPPNQKAVFLGHDRSYHRSGVLDGWQNRGVGWRRWRYKILAVAPVSASAESKIISGQKNSHTVSQSKT